MNTKTPAHGHCEACGRPLTDPVSIKAGVGPICRANGYVRTQLSIFDSTSNYTVEIAGDVICVTDLDQGGRSVTNDSEGVIRDLAQAGYDLDRMPVIYRDSRGIWDEMIVRDGAFAGFRSINERDRTEALAAIVRRLVQEQASRNDLEGILAMAATGFTEMARVTTDSAGNITAVHRP